jgi:hypothetical protein
MKTLFIDTEFNGFGGRLLSMAIVCDDYEFYEVLEIGDEVVDPWVEEHVVPGFNKTPISVASFFEKLYAFLFKASREGSADLNIVADWPTDLVHFLEAITIGTGQAMKISPKIILTLDATVGGSYVSKVPHNALEDARALKKALEK